MLRNKKRPIKDKIAKLQLDKFIKKMRVLDEEREDRRIAKYGVGAVRGAGSRRIMLPKEKWIHCDRCPDAGYIRIPNGAPVPCVACISHYNSVYNQQQIKEVDSED